MKIQDAFQKCCIHCQKRKTICQTNHIYQPGVKKEVSKNEEYTAFYYLPLRACISYFVILSVNFQLLAKILNFIFIEYAWKLAYLRWCYVFIFCPLLFPSKGGGTWSLGSEHTLDHLILRVGCTSYNLPHRENQP